jgi:hypothetical protein
VKIHERSVSPARPGPPLRVPSPLAAFGHSGTGTPAMGMHMGGVMAGPGNWAPLQVARMQQPPRNDFQRSMMETGGLPSLRWP